MKKNIIWRFCALVLCLCLLSAALGGCGAGNTAPPSGFIGNTQEVVSAIRRDLRDHSSRIRVRFTYNGDILDRLPELAGVWMEEALKETGEPDEGDYIRYQYGGYRVLCDREEDGEAYRYTVTIVPKYYMYLFQEQIVTEKVGELMAQFSFDGGASDYEKIRTIYDYVCSSISYDRVHEGNPYHTLRSTSYAGLIWGSATCQGYCVTLYRLLREAGISCRIVTGSGGDSGTLHAWVIAELDGKYYCMDATWDSGKEEYSYFLKGSDTFDGHTPSEEFLSGDFAAQYPISPSDYEDK
ncbi:MAG: hypothetical protein IJ072_04250 [Oscillospiraceae bacterium]|nr:hypothetical protein [Oscillospiraceae bacterium]